MRLSRLIPIFATITLAVCASTRGAQEENDKPLTLTWNVIENHGEMFDATLSITNGQSTAWEAPQWALYCNSSRKLEINPAEDDKGSVTLEHINGDLFVFRPTENWKKLEPGETRSIAIRGLGNAIKPTDCPCGFYFVITEPGAEHIARIEQPKYVIVPFTRPVQLNRSQDDLWPIPTAASRFVENQKVRRVDFGVADLIVPTPKEIAALEGEVVVDRASVISYEPGLGDAAKLLATYLEAVLGTPPRIVEGNEEGLHGIRISRRLDGQPADEGYRMRIDPRTGIAIQGNSDAGVFYAIQSLRALLPLTAEGASKGKVILPAMQVDDAPRFTYRGLHVDVARHFHSAAFIKKLLDAMAFYKLNRLHLHLSDDEGWRLEIKSLPELSEIGSRRGHTADESEYLLPTLGSGPAPDGPASSGFFSQVEFIDLLRYAYARQIQVIPEIDVPGHARAAIKAMEIRGKRLLAAGEEEAAAACRLTNPEDKSQYESVQFWHDNVVDPGRESTYQLLATVFDELQDMYAQAGAPLTTIHIGGDEVPAGAWEESPDCQRLVAEGIVERADRRSLKEYFNSRVLKLLHERGLKASAWQETMLADEHNNGQNVKSIVPPEKLGDGNSTVAYVWDSVWGWGQEDLAYRLANSGYDVVLCNATHLYLDLAYNKDPSESGYHWAAFVDVRDPFEFEPLNVYRCARANRMGHPITHDAYADAVALEPGAEKRIIGMQGHLWGELLASDEQLEYMAFPKVIALAERAWGPTPSWESTDDFVQHDIERDAAWNKFATLLGTRECSRLGAWFGLGYRVPPPGAMIQNGVLNANVAYPGLQIRYTSDGSEPSAHSTLFDAPVSIDGSVRVKAFAPFGGESRSVEAVHDD
jgi:hexosaminidase